MGNWAEFRNDQEGKGNRKIKKKKFLLKITIGKKTYTHHISTGKFGLTSGMNNKNLVAATLLFTPLSTVKQSQGFWGTIALGHM